VFFQYEKTLKKRLRELASPKSKQSLLYLIYLDIFANGFSKRGLQGLKLEEIVGILPPFKAPVGHQEVN